MRKKSFDLEIIDLTAKYGKKQKVIIGHPGGY
jgi:hypothetical protein